MTPYVISVLRMYLLLTSIQSGYLESRAERDGSGRSGQSRHFPTRRYRRWKLQVEAEARSKGVERHDQAVGMADRKEISWSVFVRASLLKSADSRTTGLDLIRLVSLSVPLSDAIPSLLEVAQSTAGTTKEQETNTMLAFRALANTFVTPAGKSMMKESAAEVRLHSRSSYCSRS